MIRRQKQRDVTREDLSAFADGQLSRARSARVAAHLRAHPEDADRVHAYWKREAELYRTFTSARAQSLDPAGPGNDGSRFPLWIGVAAALLVLAVGVSQFWRGGDLPPPAMAGMTTGEVQGGVEPPATYAGLELQPQSDKNFSLNGKTLEYHFTTVDGTSLKFYEADLHGGVGAVSPAGVSVVEWVDGGRHYALTGLDSDARLIAMAVLLRRQLAVPATGTSSAVAEAPAADPALQPAAEEILPAEVSRM